MLGAISLHGTSSQPQATHLAAPVAPGDSVINVTDAAQWQPGEEIFLTSTGHSWEEAEYAIVAACNGTTVTLASPLRFAHFGAADMFRDAAITNKTKFEGMDNRAQVLLLTRSITIEGGGEERDGRGAKLLVTELEVEREDRGIPVTTMCATILPAAAHSHADLLCRSPTIRPSSCGFAEVYCCTATVALQIYVDAHSAASCSSMIYASVKWVLRLMWLRYRWRARVCALY